MITRLALLLLAVVAAAAAPAATTGQLAAQTNGAAKRSVVDSVYTEDQATRGETAFKAYCASCHEPSFHSGEQFRMNWFGRSVYDLFKILKTTMPEDNIGGLSDDDYSRVIAYILKLNGFPAGTDSLPSDSLTTQRLRIGPPPLVADSAKKNRR